VLELPDHAIRLKAAKQLFAYVGVGKTKIVAEASDANTAVTSLHIHLESNGHVAEDAPQPPARSPRFLHISCSRAWLSPSLFRLRSAYSRRQWAALTVQR
jgi:hypothetical protein